MVVSTNCGHLTRYARGQQEEWTTGGQLEEDSGMSRGHQGVQREERTTTMVDTKKGSIYNQNGVFNKKGCL